jgi:hypothetical protein
VLSDIALRLRFKASSIVTLKSRSGRIEQENTLTLLLRNKLLTLYLNKLLHRPVQKIMY